MRLETRKLEYGSHQTLLLCNLPLFPWKACAVPSPFERVKATDLLDFPLLFTAELECPQKVDRLVMGTIAFFFLV